MKKGTIFALAALVVALIAFFLTRKDVKTTVEAPYIVKAVKDLKRIELTRPGNELVVLEKSDPGWKLSKPVSAPLNEDVVKQLDEIFANDIRTDDIKYSKDKLEEYELGEKGTKAALYAAGAQTPAVQFTVGKEQRVEGTGVRRSFIASEKGQPFRAQTTLEILRKPVNELRSKTVITADKDRLTAISVTHGDATASLELVSGDWVMKSPEEGMPLESSVVDSAVRTLSNLRAMDFADDAKPSEIGLEPPMYALHAKMGDTDVKVDLGQAGDQWYARIPGESFIYKLSPSSAKSLALTVDTLRNRHPLTMHADDIERVEFAGGDKVVVVRNADTWSIIKPAKQAASDQKIKSRIPTIADITVARYASDVTPEEAGLGSAKDSLIVTTRNGKYELRLGKNVENSEDRYAKWVNNPHIFVLPKYIVDRLSPSIKDLTDS